MAPKRLSSENMGSLKGHMLYTGTTVCLCSWSGRYVPQRVKHRCYELQHLSIVARDSQCQVYMIQYEWLQELSQCHVFCCEAVGAGFR